MISEDGEWIICDGSEDETCENKIKNHAWGKIKADGWFHTKDDRFYCPQHQAWLAGWRKRKAERKQNS